jgi:hypothetical protein
VLARAEKLGFDPLVYVLDVAADENAERSERMEAAKIALPYCHARLSSSHNTSESGKSHAEWLEDIARDLEGHDDDTPGGGQTAEQDGDSNGAERSKGKDQGNGDVGRGEPDETGGATVLSLVPGRRTS